MKIACITDDGRTISQHFGRAPFYVVLTIEDGEIVHREMVSKMAHPQAAAHETEEESAGRHGTGAASHEKHVSMAEVIRGCEALLCRGMGYGAYQSMQQVGIRPVVTDIIEIDEAVRAYIEGRLEDHPEKLH